MQQLRTQIAELQRKVEELTTATNSHSRATRRLTRTDNPSSQLCWYHRRFGKAAKQVHTPGDFGGNESPSSCRRPMLLPLVALVAS
ncbi:hypothetical protein M513_14303, partial [Trichuris suis]